MITKTLFTTKEARGGAVLRSASGTPVHVSKPRGEAFLSKLGGNGAIKRAAEARRALHER